MQVEIGVIGGSGLYELVGLEGVDELEVETPYGPPSDRVRVGQVAGRAVAFLARHGRGHRVLPGEINYRANLYALKRLGVERVLAAGAVGSLRENVHPLDLVLPDQFYDRTRQRPSTFFGGGVVAHVGFADPVCPELVDLLAAHGAVTGRTVHRGGTYVCMEGPQFSTRAESHAYRALGGTVIGMTGLQEAKLAREAEMCYAAIALVTDYDCWRAEEDAVTVEAVVERLQANATAATRLIRAVLPALPGERKCSCGHALAGAVLTAPEAIPEEAKRRLWPILGRYLAGRA